MTYVLLILGATACGAYAGYELLLLALQVLIAAFGLGRSIINYRKDGA